MRLVGITIQGSTGTVNLERHNQYILIVNVEKTPPKTTLVHDSEDVLTLAVKVALKIGYDNDQDIKGLETLIRMMRHGT